MADSVKVRRLTRSEHRMLAAKLKDRTLRVRVHRRYRVIAEVARGRPVAEVADRVGCHLSMASSGSPSWSCDCCEGKRSTQSRARTRCRTTNSRLEAHLPRAGGAGAQDPE